MSAQRGNAIGLIEYKTVAAGILAADTMVKTAEVKLIEAQTVCPGKYIALICGSLSAVRSAVDAAIKVREEEMIGHFVIGNLHEGIFPALYGSVHIGEVDALGILETYDVATAIVAADEAAKTAAVDLIEIRIAKGMCGKSFFFLTGEVAAVEAAIAKARSKAGENGMYLDSTVIPHPDAQIRASIL